MTQSVTALPVQHPLVPEATQKRILMRLKQKGFLLLYHGINTSTFISPDHKYTYVLFAEGRSEMSPAHKVHLAWMKFCQQHMGPNVLKILDVTSGTTDGIYMTQVYAERLKKIPAMDPLAKFLELHGFDLTSALPGDRVGQLHAMQELKKAATNVQRFLQELARLSNCEEVSHEDAMKYSAFIRTVCQIVRIAPQRTILSLNHITVAERGSTPVIVDPYFVTSIG
jgi:hypothetical protein